jgi:hypothetical protein
MEMEGCSLNDAFPDGAFGSPGCLDRGAADESRRQEKKKARRCRGPALTYLDGGMNMVGAVDPDRTAQKPAPVPALNTATGLREHAPVSQQYNYETFVGDMDSLPQIRQDVQGPNALQSSTPPSFFGANPNDDNSTSIVAKKRTTEGFQSGAAPFMNVIGSEEAYTLQPDFTKSFSTKGAARAEGVPTPSGPSPTSQEMSYLTPTGMMPNSILPVPNIDVFWKENGLAGGQSSFFSQLKAPGGQPAGSAVDQDAASDVPASRREVLTKLDKIFARLDDMEAQKTENAQTEVLLFIMTGLGVIFLMDIGCRAAASFGRK